MTTDDQTEPWLVRAARQLRRDPSIVPEMVTLLGAATILIIDPFVDIKPEQLFTATIGILGALALSGLIERLTRLRRIDENIANVRDHIGSRAFRADVADALDESLPLLRRCRESGVRWLYDALTDVAIVDGFRSARTVRIMQTWTANAAGLKEVLRSVASAGGEVRVLLLNPDSPLASYRSLAMGTDANHSPSAIRVELPLFAQLAADPAVAGRLTVRVYDTIPSFSMYAYDNVRIIGIYWQRRYALESPQFEVVGDPTDSGRRSILAKYVDEHFDYVWNDPRTKILEPSPTGAIDFT